MAGEEKEEKKEQAPAEKKKLPMKLIIIVLAVVLVLGGAAAGYFLFFGHKGKAAGKEDTGKETKKEQVKEEGSKKGGEGEGVSGNMKQLDPFIVNLADAEGQRYLKAVMQFEVDNPAAESEIQEKLPQIRDEILMILSNKTFDDVSATAGKRMVKREIASAVNKYLTSGQVKQVYFTEFVVQ
jgi:flagellar protein FliL